MEGRVAVDGNTVDKSGALVKESSVIEISDDERRFVSRGGRKLEHALAEFDIDTQDKIAIDIGASTGGFTDCLLQRGAKKVYAVDVGYGQLDWTLRNDERVVVMEKINARHLVSEDIGERVDIVVIDVSFISLTKVIPPAAGVLKRGGVLVALIKPQFEVGKAEVGKGGVIRDESKRQRVVEAIRSYLEDMEFQIMGVVESPISGAKGNIEYLIAGRLS